MDAVSLTADHASRIAFPASLSVLLDVTRLVELGWSRRQPNGIDRVCGEYLRHFRLAARAVIQYRGAVRVLGEAASRRLFDLLAEGPADGARTRIAALLVGALAGGHRPVPGSLYLNVSHTDFDLAAHARWVNHHGLRAIYLVHDLIPILQPEHCRPHAVMRHTGRVQAALRHGAGIVVGSAAVARDLHDYADRRRLAVPPVLVAPLAGARLHGAASPPDAPRDYFLCVGTIESRKNHRLLLDVWQRLRARLGVATPRLVVVGRWGHGVDALRQALSASGMVGGLVEVLDHCPDDRLVALMRGARAMLMPSLAEGFGLPMAEALAMGIPVVASDLPCFREVGRSIPTLLDPRDAAAWEARIVALDPATSRRQRRIDALHGYRPPTWEEHFERVDPWLAAIAPAPARPSWNVAGDRRAITTLPSFSLGNRR